MSRYADEMLRYLAEHYLFPGVQGLYIYPRSGKLV